MDEKDKNVERINKIASGLCDYFQDREIHPRDAAAAMIRTIAVILYGEADGDVKQLERAMNELGDIFKSTRVVIKKAKH